MSNRTWVCLECEKSQRRYQMVPEVTCPHCQKPCEYVHWKIHIPSPKRKRQWKIFWDRYLREKAIYERWVRTSGGFDADLVILNKKLMQRKPVEPKAWKKRRSATKRRSPPL